MDWPQSGVFDIYGYFIGTITQLILITRYVYLKIFQYFVTLFKDGSVHTFVYCMFFILTVLFTFRILYFSPYVLNTKGGNMQPYLTPLRIFVYVITFKFYRGCLKVISDFLVNSFSFITWFFFDVALYQRHVSASENNTWMLRKAFRVPTEFLKPNCVVDTCSAHS